MKILLVCYGNICRSPMAEALFRQAMQARPALKHVAVDSAGVSAIEGNRATAPAVQVMQEEFGLDVRPHRAKPVAAGADHDLFLALDTSTRVTLERRRPGASIDTLGGYAGTGEDVRDPYGDSLETYRQCAAHIAALVAAAVARLEAELGGRRP